MEQKQLDKWKNMPSRFGAGVSKISFEDRINILLAYDRSNSGRIRVSANLIVRSGKREGSEENFAEIARRAKGLYYESRGVQEAIIESLRGVSGVFPEARGELLGVVAKAEELNDWKLLRWISRKAEEVGDKELKEAAQQAFRRVAPNKPPLP